MEIGSIAVQKKQPITIDAEAFKSSLQTYQGEFEEVRNCGILVVDDQSFDDAAIMAVRAKGLIKKFDEAFKPVSDSIKAVEKTLKSAVEVFTEPLNKYMEGNRTQCLEYLTQNKDAKPECGRIQSSKWKLVVNDEEALLKSMVTATNKKGEDGKMYIDIQLNPQIRALFPYDKAKGNALASVVTTTLPLAGCVVKQDSMLVLTGEK